MKSGRPIPPLSPQELSPSRSTYQYLDCVSSNLYRHRVSGVYYGFRKIAGKRRCLSLKTADRKTAERKLAEWLRDLGEVDTSNPDVTLAMLIENFRAARTAKSKSTTGTEAGILKEFQASFPKPMNTFVSRVKPSDLAAWLARIRPNKRASTYNRWRLWLRQLFDLSMMDGVVSRSPFVDHLLPLAKKERVVRLIPTEDEFRAIVETIRNPVKEQQCGRRGGQRPAWQHESADFVEFLGLAGVGQAEASYLRWSDIDEKRNEIQYTRQKTRKPFKTPIYGWLKPLILRLKEARKAGGDTKVFAIREVKHALATACSHLYLPHFTHRSLRAMRIKRLWEAGVDVKVIAEWQGHSDGGKLIMDTYTEVFGSNDSGYRQAQLKKAEAAMQATSAPDSPLSSG
jgi:integrase